MQLRQPKCVVEVSQVFFAVLQLEVEYTTALLLYICVPGIGFCYEYHECLLTLESPRDCPMLHAMFVSKKCNIIHILLIEL